MKLQDLLVLAIAVYGAILSTILGIREFKREKRRIIILLVDNVYSQTYSVIITNIGYRPITLIDLFIDIPKSGSVPIGVKTQEGNWPFPVTLTDGQHIAIKISMTISEHIRKDNGDITIVIYDAEGRTYNKYTKLAHNDKYGGYHISR